MDVEDVSDFLVNLFMEEYALTFNIRSFYTAKKNQALIAIQAFIYCFPSKILGCWFHFEHCLFRKLIELGLKCGLHRRSNLQ